ncbi:DUF4303 domain-containing protein [Blastopirellula marina]|uniref:DUF4303 domain-containing protein n=1 Tax=Blastopirellula marina DSM 3645 TaxID=314230 RepID=A4A2F8_9BACT|nr:DUF4303 domain-containing protein [Blastopirellula marina]EAQ77025.1 hypothetical protein DSM3645_04215 [Blastopirellula marina DSM 3645]
MQSIDPTDDIAQWRHVLHQELVAHLNELRNDPTVCGFALELPSDFSNDGIISRIAKRSNAPAEKDNIPSLDEWKYVPNGKTFGSSCDGLAAIYSKYDEPLEDEQFYDEFGNTLYEACLNAMQQCVASSEFGDITIRLLTLSDDEHPILGKAIALLNDPPSQAIANRLLMQSEP